MTVSLVREGVEFESMVRNQAVLHAGLLLDHGLASIDDDEIPRLIAAVANCPASDVYKKAYERWQRRTDPAEGPGRFAVWEGRIAQRLFLMRGETGVLETSARLHHTYGMPYLPGSMLKGIARAHAVEEGSRSLDEAAVDILFGRGPEDPADPAGESPEEMGCVIFHDAWWMPGSAPSPLVREVITPHHGDYYLGNPDSPSPRDTDSPIPTTQIAVRGGFRFVVECPGGWGRLGLDVLRVALCHEGLGNRTHLGYGLFVDCEATAE